VGGGTFANPWSKSGGIFFSIDIFKLPSLIGVQILSAIFIIYCIHDIIIEGFKIMLPFSHFFENI
jgi:hypothetical protein